MNGMLSNHKKILVIGCGMIWFWLLLFMPENAFSQDSTAASHKLVVGTMVAPPVYIKTTDGQWEGLGIEIWQAVARQLGLLFEFREYSGPGPLREAIKNGEIDVIPSLPAEVSLVSIVDYCQSYLRTGLAIAVPAEGTYSRWMATVTRIFSKDTLEAFGLLMLLSLVAGTIVWLFERRRNSEMFDAEAVKGVGHGIWWSIVTMTGVGYGDKTPKSIGGRTVAIIWMLFSIVFIASFTANITTSLTISELRGKVRGFNDLYNARVGSISHTEASDFLTRHGITAQSFESIQDGLQAVANKKIDAFVLNEIILRYLVKNEFAGRVQVIPGTFNDYFVSIALQEKSPLRKPINKTLLELMKTEEWNEMMDRYIK